MGRRVLVLGWLAVLLLSTASRARDWRSPVALWQATTQTAPHSPQAWVNAADALVTAGQWAQADAAAWRAYHLAATRSDRRVAQTWAAINLAAVACARSRWAEARTLVFTLGDPDVLAAIRSQNHLAFPLEQPGFPCVSRF